MRDEMKLELWRLVSDLSVEDAAILIAGGDPSDFDWEDDTFGRQYSVKRTDGHHGYLATFTSLTNAIRKGHLPAKLAFRAGSAGPYSGKLSGEIWLLSDGEVDVLRQQFENDPFADTPLDWAHGFQVQVEPDWTSTTIEVEALKAWLRSRGFTEGFFFPANETSPEDPASFMDPSHEHFAPELALAVSAWRALASEQRFVRGPKSAIESWIERNPDAWKGDGELSISAKERISVLVNWKKNGGAPSTDG